MDNEQIIKFFIEEPEAEFHVRQISRILKKSPTTVSKYLKKYEKENILKSEKKFNHLFFRANSENRIFKQIKLNYNLNSLRRSGIIEYIEEELNYPKAIVLFGSFAKAEDNLKSDIDLLVVSSSKKKIGFKKFEEKLGKNIQLFVHSKEEIKKLKQKNKGLVNSWLNGIVLSGSLEIF